MPPQNMSFAVEFVGVRMRNTAVRRRYAARYRGAFFAIRLCARHYACSRMPAPRQPPPQPRRVARTDERRARLSPMIMSGSVESSPRAAPALSVTPRMSWCTAYAPRAFMLRARHRRRRHTGAVPFDEHGKGHGDEDRGRSTERRVNMPCCSRFR